MDSQISGINWMNGDDIPREKKAQSVVVCLAFSLIFLVVGAWQKCGRIWEKGKIHSILDRLS